jgi:two-component system sensor histidine kinase KdpD
VPGRNDLRLRDTSHGIHRGHVVAEHAYSCRVRPIPRSRLTFRRPTGARLAKAAGLIALVLAVATVVVALLESPAIGLLDASPVYFVAVVIAGSLIGTGPALATAIGSFLVYDLLFTEPRFTLLVSDSKEWLDLVLFVVLAVVVGRLSAVGTERAVEASRRVAESTALFAISRILATAADVETVAPQVAERLVHEGGLQRVWIATDRGGRRHVVADTEADRPIPESSIVTALVRTPGDTPAHWVRAHEPRPHEKTRASDAGRSNHGGPIIRVRMEADGVPIGSLKAVLRPGVDEPDRVTTRLLALAADQLALAIRRDDLRREATEVEIARRADALKSALLDTVSHDLRTPLASIRAAAGSLADPDVAIDAASARATAAAIDAEADRLDRLVREVLDLSRIEAGSLRPELEPLVLADAVGLVVERLRPILAARKVTVSIPDELPPVRADAVLLDGLLTNLIENVARHTGGQAPLEVSAREDANRVLLVIDDGGPGVPAAERDRLFEKFYRLPVPAEGSRRGLGVGLAIVRGMTEAMGGTVSAGPSPLGGLRIVVDLPADEAPMAGESLAAGESQATNAAEAPAVEAAVAPGVDLPVEKAGTETVAR